MSEQVPGFVAPVHRALTEPILMGGAPRSVAILNGTLAAALGLGLRLWIAGLGEAHVCVLTVVGFPTATTPGILDDLNRLAFPYRWSTRAGRSCSARPMPKGC